METNLVETEKQPKAESASDDFGDGVGSDSENRVPYHTHDGKNSPKIAARLIDGLATFISDNLALLGLGALAFLNRLNKLEETVTVIGSYAVGDLLVYIRAATNVIIQRYEGPAGNTQRDFGTIGVPETAARFTAPYDFTLTSIRVYVNKTASPSDNLIARLYTDSTNSPGTQIELSATTVAGSSISAPGFVTFNFTSALTANTKYWIILDRDGANDNTNYYNVQRNNLWSDGSVQSIFPNSLAKSSSATLTGWGTTDACFRIEFKGTIAGGYYKWTGNRTSRLVVPYGVVTGVDGSTATVCLSGKATGLSGMTPGTIQVINYCKVGIALTATEMLVWIRKPFVVNSDLLGSNGLLLTVSTVGSADCFIPLGFVPKTRHDGASNANFSFTSCEEGEIYDTVTGGGGGATHTDKFSDEYEEI